MTAAEAFAVGAGGFIGAVLRYFISTRMNKEKRIPMGTFAVNLVGSLLIGLIFGFELPKLWTVFLVSGLVGALTTFSTLMKELIQLWRSGQRKEAIFYSIWTFGFGTLLAYVGFVIGQLC
ncbi:fluoride efflux transporter CrcB [Sporosarcina luteola]|uniref:fluoride efflux transporter CrcB n=1 Tax=Sporosarcina luteola TaxID=582850 RepID=UPI00203DC524|nr:fluoride efflux transporter CrcB [Sporosarcina luteola]MCM3710233.1 fluoride efflux transporter CrcB [Sporosarcina luteola]